MRRRQRLNYEKSQKFAANCVYVAIFIQGAILTYFLYQVTLGGQTDWENLYGCYFCVVTSGGFLIAHGAKRSLKTVDSEQMRSMLQGIRIWSPLVIFSILGILLTWPLLLSPDPIESWKVGFLFFTLFTIGAFFQLLILGAMVPRPSKSETRMAIKALPWLQKLFLDKSLHAGLSILDRPAPNTAVIAAELTQVPCEKVRTFKTQFDGQQQVMLDFFWEIYGQQFHCERFTISNIPTGPAGEKTFEVRIKINFDRTIDCKVEKPLIVVKTCIEPKSLEA